MSQPDSRAVLKRARTASDFIVTLYEPSIGGDNTIATGVVDWVNNTWGKNTGNACAAFVTFQVTLSGQDILIEPSVYTYPDTVDWTSGFCIGSVQKVFTGTILAGRILQGASISPQFSLRSNAAQWLCLENIPSEAIIGSITLAELATHTACMARTVRGEDQGLYDKGGGPDQAQKDQWLKNSNWLDGCDVGVNVNYSNWGSLTLGFAVAQPSGYVYNDALAALIYPYFGVTAQYTNTNIDTPCVPGFLGDGSTPATGKAHGIRSTIAEMALFVGHYLYYNMLYQTGDTTDFACRQVNMALTPPIDGVPLGIDWFIRPLKVAGKPYTVFDKNGMTGAQGFSSYVGFTEPLALEGDGLIQAGVLVLLNLANATGPNTPTSFGWNGLKYLLGDFAPGEAPEQIADDADEQAVLRTS